MNAALGLSLAILFVIGVPIAVAIGLASVIGIEAQGRLPLLLVAQRMFTGIDSFPLMAIPLFILAGNLMETGGISRRLVNFAKSLVGGVQGGLVMDTAARRAHENGARLHGRKGSGVHEPQRGHDNGAYPNNDQQFRHLFILSACQTIANSSNYLTVITGQSVHSASPTSIASLYKASASHSST